jgi:restriction system protein
MENVAEAENLTPEEIETVNARGTNIFRSRINWASTYLVQAKALTRPERGYLEITDRGRQLLIDHPQGFDEKVLKDFPEWKDAWSGKYADEYVDRSEEKSISDSSPTETIESTIDELESLVANDLVQRVRAMSPKFLELVVLQLLQKMGYGDDSSAIQHLGGPGDEGVDGVINQDSLGLQRIYIQAKRYKEGNTIGRPDIQKFVGALTGLGANGGVFITTSDFSSDARDYADKTLPNTRIVLIDGSTLGHLMVRHGIGVQVRRTYQLVDVNEDFFDE